MYPLGIYLLKVVIRSTRTRCEICSKLIIKRPERHHWRRSGVFIINFEHISLLVLVFLLLTGSRYMPAGYVYVHVYIWESGGLNLRKRFLLKLMENIFGRNRLTEMVLFIRKGKVLSICASEKILLLYYYYFY